MKKIVLIALTVFLSVVASAQNIDNGCMYSPTHSPTVEAVQLDAYQADVVYIDMNFQCYGMPETCLYRQFSEVVYFDFQSSTIAYFDTGQDISHALPWNPFTNYFRRNASAQRHRLSGIMIRQVQAS